MNPEAGMAKLADAADLKSAGPKRPVGVRFPLPAPAGRPPQEGFSVRFGERRPISLGAILQWRVQSEGNVGLALP